MRRRSSRTLATMVAAGALACVAAVPASADPIVTVLDLVGGSTSCQSAGGGHAHAIARVEGGSTGTRVELDLSWQHYTEPVVSQTVGCPDTVFTNQSGFCAWRSDYWSNPACFGPQDSNHRTDGSFVCNVSACGYSSQRIVLSMNVSRQYGGGCRADLYGYLGSGTFTATVTGTGDNHPTHCDTYWHP